MERRPAHQSSVAPMGSILHDTRKISFESWNDIKKAYSHAFKKSVDDAFDPPEALLKVEKIRRDQP
jgi:hypothetical protein